jgi:hypothetical protein
VFHFEGGERVTVSEARVLLTAPKFGDDGHIRAARMLALLEEMRGLPGFRSDHGICRVCRGSGECQCPECNARHDCGECSGSGKNSEGIASLTEQNLVAMRKRLALKGGRVNPRDHQTSKEWQEAVDAAEPPKADGTT